MAGLGVSDFFLRRMIVFLGVLLGAAAPVPTAQAQETGTAPAEGPTLPALAEQQTECGRVSVTADGLLSVHLPQGVALSPLSESERAMIRQAGPAQVRLMGRVAENGCLVGLQIPSRGGEAPLALLARTHGSQLHILLREAGTLVWDQRNAERLEARRLSPFTTETTTEVQDTEAVETACQRASASQPLVHRRSINRRWNERGDEVEPEDMGEPFFVDCRALSTRRSPGRQLRSPALRRRRNVEARVLATDALSLVPGRPTEEVRIRADGTLTAGNARGLVDLSDFGEVTLYEGEAPTRFDVSEGSVEVSARCHRATQNLLWVEMRSVEIEESFWRRLQVFARRGRRLVRVFFHQEVERHWMSRERLERFRPNCETGAIERYHVQDDGDARVPYPASDSDQADASHPGSYSALGRVVREIYRRRGGRFSLVTESTPLLYDLGAFAACPAVYVQGPEGPTLQGEILRYLSGADRFAIQTLPIEAPFMDEPPNNEQEREVTIHLAEEKEEVTYLDAIALYVGGVRVLPESCGATADTPAYCQRDGRNFALHEGDVITLRFRLPGDSDAALALEAIGYYLPLTNGGLSSSEPVLVPD